MVQSQKVQNHAKKQGLEESKDKDKTGEEKSTITIPRTNERDVDLFVMPNKCYRAEISRGITYATELQHLRAHPQ